MKNPLKAVLSTLAIGAIALSLSACTTNDSTKPTTAPTPTVQPTPLLTFDKLKGVDTQLALAKAFTGDLKQGGVKSAANGGARYGKLSAGSGFAFPISGGNVSYYNPKVRQSLPDGIVQGVVLHSGSGISLSKGSVKMVVQDLTVNPATKGTITGDIFVNDKAVASDVLLFNLDGSTLKPLTQNSIGAAVISGYKATLAEPFVKVLNSRFKTDAFEAKDAVGSATLTLTLPKGKK